MFVVLYKKIKNIEKNIQMTDECIRKICKKIQEKIFGQKSVFVVDDSTSCESIDADNIYFRSITIKILASARSK